MNYHTFDITVVSTGVEHRYRVLAKSSTQGEASAEINFRSGRGNWRHAVAEHYG